VSINCEATTGSLPKESAVPLALVDDKGIVIFDPAKVVTLLTEKGTEAFEGERAIRLFQFLTWILFPQMPETKYVKWAGLMATVKFLDRMEEWHFMDKESTRLRNEGEETTVDLDTKPPQTISRIATLRQDNSAYRRVYDLMIGKRGGLLGLLDTPSPASFDHAVRERIDRMHIISNLIDCRLRYIQHGCGGARGADNRDGANHNHAMFFCWWPTHSIKGRRGKTSPDKSASIRTMRTWWKKLATSAFFVYLNDTHGFKQLPPTTDDDFFVDELLRLSNDTAELKRFFGAYLYLTNTFREAGGDFAYVPVPASIKPVSISTSRFSKTELETISHYDEHYLSMND
jgi:hypothetical protein